jgi:PGF-CTERM protein
MKDHRYTRTLFLALIVVAGVFAGGALAASDGSVEADPSTADETAQHVVTVTVGDDSAGSLTGLEVDYSGSGIDLNNVSQADIVKIGIDRDDDADGRETDENANDDLNSVSASNDGETLRIDTGGSYSIASDDAGSGDAGDGDADGETTTETPGFGAVVALVALTGTALLVARRA